jgi:hypothetical protein
VHAVCQFYTALALPLLQRAMGKEGRIPDGRVAVLQGGFVARKVARRPLLLDHLDAKRLHGTCVNPDQSATSYGGQE